MKISLRIELDPRCARNQAQDEAGDHQDDRVGRLEFAGHDRKNDDEQQQNEEYAAGRVHSSHYNITKGARYNAHVSDAPATQRMQCMEVWGGSQLTSAGVEFGGLDAWVYSKPYGQAKAGGDVYYASSCATGRISRLLLADVSGHGNAVAATAADLRTLMRRFVNRLDQTEFVRLLNQQFMELSEGGTFATAIVSTFFAPSRRLDRLQRGSSAAADVSCGAAALGFPGTSFTGRGASSPRRATYRWG